MWLYKIEKMHILHVNSNRVSDMNYESQNLYSDKCWIECYETNILHSSLSSCEL